MTVLVNCDNNRVLLAYCWRNPDDIMRDIHWRMQGAGVGSVMAPKRPTNFLFCVRNRFQDKFADSPNCDSAKRRSAPPPDQSDQGLCPWTSLGP